MKHLTTTAIAALLVCSPVYAAGALNGAPTCPEGVQSCNIAGVFKDNSQQVDSNDNTYAPDSATANASVGDVIAQGGAADAQANGNHSVNNNQSSANNSATNTMSNGSISNAVTGGSANVAGGSANVTGGSANVAGGRATTNSGNISSAAQGGNGGKGGEGGEGGAGYGGFGYGGNQQQGQQMRGSSNSGGNSVRGGDTRIDASSRTVVKHAAAQAAPVVMGGYGAGNCFGDTNPSGQFGASIQVFGWGATANSMKASNVCAVNQIAGGAVALGYLAKMDPNVARALDANPTLTLTNGQVVITKKEAERRKADALAAQVAEAEAQRRATQLMQCPSGYDLIRAETGRMTCRLVPVDRVERQVAKPMLERGMKCPAGSAWDGRGCKVGKR